MDRRPTKKPRWLRDPPDPDTVVRWAKNARDQAERARTFARDYRAALERKEKGRPPSIVLLRARSLSDRDLRSRVAKKGLCAGLCGTHSDSKYLRDVRADRPARPGPHPGRPVPLGSSRVVMGAPVYPRGPGPL